MTVIDRHKNNFDFLRVLAALCIAFTHSYGLLGHYVDEPLVQISNQRFDFSHIGLCIFFSISGYLITKSAATSITLVNFAWKRLLRIQPMLILVCLFSVFILGPFFSNLTTSQYFSSLQTWTYFRNVMPVFGIQFKLPAVFSNLSDTGVNGSLWTLIVEERLYIIVGMIALFKAKKRQVFVMIVWLLNAVFIGHHLLFDGDLIDYFNESHMQYAMMFLNAGFLYHLNFPFKLSANRISLLAVLAIVILVNTQPLIYVWVWVVPVAILGFAFTRNVLNKTGIYGDFTYGIYIFAFPVQQMVIEKYGSVISPVQLFFITMSICIPLAILSWHLLEKKCLLFKDKVGVKT